MLFGFIDFAIWLWWISIPLLLHVFIALAFSAKRISLRNVLFAWLPCLYPVILTFFGYVYRQTGGRADAPEGPIIFAGVLYLGQILLCGYIVYRYRGARWYAAAAGLFAVWLGFWGLTIAQMAVTNVWL